MDAQRQPHLWEHIYRSIVEQAGARYLGMQETLDEPHVLFNDPVTDSTLALPQSFVTLEEVEKRMRISRMQFEEARMP